MQKDLRPGGRALWSDGSLSAKTNVLHCIPVGHHEFPYPGAHLKVQREPELHDISTSRLLGAFTQEQVPCIQALSSDKFTGLLLQLQGPETTYAVQV